MNTEGSDDLLDRYVAGMPLSDQEERVINNLLTTDTAFRQEYQLRRDLFHAGRHERRAAWAARQQVRPLPTDRPVFPMRWAAAASIVLLLGLGLLFWAKKPGGNSVLTGSAALFRQRDTQLGLAGTDSAVGTVTWLVVDAPKNQYEFSQLDTLRIFATNPDAWKGQNWRLTSLSEVRYELRVGNRTYLLEQGRSIRLPLEPVK